ncbi:hypothetical protein SUDANB171_04036 [Streptomyces sp. enrichment culture]|uniref:DUF4180 domain-containing protein n=1 Tax=Streptomyces sp. enrichment culture TaxID=1795815 RepID=UPI003F553DB0
MTTDTDPAANSVQQLSGAQVLVCPADGPPVRDERAATDLIGEGWYLGATWVALPATRLGDDFFRLSTRVAGDIVQKFATYRLGLAVIGDISRQVEGSTPLRDFVRESNRGGQLWFLPDLDALRTRLAEQARAGG